MKHLINVKQKGFTLIELLVVISIIAILIGLGMTSFATAQKKARDSKRKTDLKEIQSALEQYYSICGFNYPTPPSGSFYSPVICAVPSLAILPTVPVDPRNITPYFCSGTCNSSQYAICAGMESETNNFCVSNKQ